MNENFASINAAGEYLNSSFGIHPIFSTNMSAAIFPLTGIGAEFHFNINNKWHIQTAVYDGKMPSFEDNPYNLNWNINKNDGALFIGEAQYIREKGIYEIGAFYHTAEKKYGVYAEIEQVIINNENRNLVSFIQSGFIKESQDFKISESQNLNYFHLAAGVNLEGVFSKEANDMAGLAFTSAFLSENKTETAIELFYQYQITDNLIIKPDVQYIVNPSGENIDNALVGTMRFMIGL